MHKENTQGLKQYLLEPRNIVITNHVNPDGDAIGSCLALSSLLKKISHNVSIISPNEPPHFLNWTPGFDDILYFDSDPEGCQNKIEFSDLIFTLDFNDLNRIGELGGVIKSSDSKKIMIDHHRNPKDYADLMFSEPEIGSTCELLYELIISMGFEKSIEKRDNYRADKKEELYNILSKRLVFYGINYILLYTIQFFLISGQERLESIVKDIKDVVSI